MSQTASHTWGLWRRAPRTVAVPAVARLSLVVLLVPWVGGCQIFTRRVPQATDHRPAVDLTGAYPALGVRRTEMLADFETPTDSQPFHIEDGAGGRNDEQRPHIEHLVRGARDDEAALAVTLRRRQRLVAACGGDSPWPSDWTGYTLLLQSVYADGASLSLETRIDSDGEAPLHAVFRSNLTHGWQRISCDLASVADRVDLAAIRSVSWSVIGDEASFYLDEIVLADNTTPHTPPDQPTGDISVETRGAAAVVRLRAGAELAFARGIITHWHDRGGPNLAAEGGLGPLLLATDDQTPWNAAARPTTALPPRVVEASAFRAVIEQPASSARLTRQLVVYRDGSTYWSINGDIATGRALTIAVAQRSGFQPLGAPPAAPDDPPVSFVLLARPEPEQADLLWVPADPAAARRFRPTTPNADTLAVSLLAEHGSAAGLLRVLPRDLDATEQAEPFAADYQHPATVQVHNGRRVTDRPGDRDGDGFNEAQGLYELAAEDRRVRVRFQPGRYERPVARFRVAGTADRRCWVYANGRIVQRLGRDAAGDVLFALPGPIDQPVTIEVAVSR